MPVKASNEIRAADEMAVSRSDDYAINYSFVSERPMPYLVHFTCALTATVCAVGDITFDTTKWYVPAPGKS